MVEEKKNKKTKLEEALRQNLLRRKQSVRQDQGSEIIADGGSQKKSNKRDVQS